MRSFCFAAAAILLTACAGDWAPPMDTADLPEPERAEDWQDWDPEANLRRKVTGEPLRSPELDAAMTGAVLEGCAPGGMRFRERLTNEGEVFDLDKNQTVARYAIQNDRLCFAYPEQPTRCYIVTRTDRGYLFYSPNGYQVIASTGTCPIPSYVKGMPEAS